MSDYDFIETLGHIVALDVLGSDPLSGRLVIEIHCGPAQGEHRSRLGAFSIAPGALQSFLRQVAAELDDADTKAPDPPH